MNVLGSRIKLLRESKGLSQIRLAQSIGITNVQLSRYETGDRSPDPETIKNIADFFDVTVDYLLGRTDVKNNEHKINIDDVDDPDDDFFLHGYLDATEEEKKEMRRYFYEMVKKRRNL